ncbi:MAG: hypothetical protein ABR992_19660, partial [Solirubrobacteraceae bacterium]
ESLGSLVVSVHLKNISTKTVRFIRNVLIYPHHMTVPTIESRRRAGILTAVSERKQVTSR